MPANFPSNPTVNQTYVYAGVSWFWTGSRWQVGLGTVLTGATGATGIGATGPAGSGGSGGSGIVILKYLQSYTANFSAGLVFNTITASGYKISSITSGTGTVTFTIG